MIMEMDLYSYDGNIWRLVSTNRNDIFLDIYFWQIKSKVFTGGGAGLKGYTTDDGYMGYVDGEYQFFASEADYRDSLED